MTQSDTISYSVRVHKRSKYLRLTLYRDRGLVVTVPGYIDHEKIQKFIATQKEWILKKLHYFNTHPFSCTPTQDSPENYTIHKEKARTLAQERLSHFNTFYNFTYSAISIKNQKTLWGSCSRKGNLNFNYKIALIPSHLADYIIVHELCHLKEFNHSKRFWDLVKKTIPNPKKLQRELRGFKI